MSVRFVPLLVGSLLLVPGSARAMGQQNSQSAPPNAPSANGQNAKAGAKTSSPRSNPAASNPFPMAQSEAAAKADAEQNDRESSHAAKNGSPPDTGTRAPASSSSKRKPGQASPAADNPFPEAQSKAAAKSDDGTGSAAGAGNSGGPGNSQAGSSSSERGYSSSDEHLPEPELGKGNLGTHPKLDSYTRDQTPIGRVDDDLNAADLYMKNGNYRGGYLRYQDALEYDPQNDTAMYGLAEALCKENATSEAMAHFKSYVTTDPQGKYARKAEKMLAHPEKCMHNR
ncbi:MAG: tetratricopeptide repeat protein [Acidobacteriaceae bacterium]